ncbi:MAG: porin family protein [Bacteroidota bacterium]
MKLKFGIVLIALFLISAGSYAQFTQYGVKAGLNLSNLTVDDTSDRNLRTGFHAGVFGRLGISEFFSLQPELLYTTKGFTNNYDLAVASSEVDFNLNYIEIPVNVVYHLSEDFAFQLGPYVGYLAGANVETNNEVLDFFDFETDSELDRDNFKSIDFGITAGLDFTLEQFIFGFKYNMGLTGVAKDNIPGELLGDEAKNSVIQVYAGILF